MATTIGRGTGVIYLLSRLWRGGKHIRVERKHLKLEFKTMATLVKPAGMKHPTTYGFCVTALLLAAASQAAFGRPIDFSEVSLLVRAHESEASIREERARR